MRYGILSDVHGNLEALEVALAHLAQCRVEQFIFLGDAVGYGPNPEEVCRRLMQLNALSVLGNHDAAVCGRMDTDAYHDAAVRALRWCRAQMSEASMKWLADLPYTLERGDLGLSHGSPLAPEDFEYLYQPEQVMALSPAQLGALKPVQLMGHSHLMVAFSRRGTQVETFRGPSIVCKPETHYFVTAGSVGQPRDRDPRLCCAVYDAQTKTLDYHRLDYDKETTRQKIVAAGLAPMFGERLFLGV